MKKLFRWILPLVGVSTSLLLISCNGDNASDNGDKSVPAVTTSSTLNEVKKRGYLNCIVSTGIAGFASPDKSGKWQGFDVDYCRAVAAAVLNDPDKVKFVTSTGKTRFTKLATGAGDVLFRNSTETIIRDTALGIQFVGINYYDGQGFMVKKDSGISSSKDLDGATVCIQTGTTTELNLADYFKQHNMKYTPVTIETNAQARQYFLAGRCDVYTTDRSALATARSTFPTPDDYTILEDIISKEPLGPAVRTGDDQWAGIVKWVTHAVVQAEDFGITSENIDTFKDTNNPGIKRFLGLDNGLQRANQALGLDDQWIQRVIQAEGNYSEIFERNIGEKTAVGLSRGKNALAKNGGLQYSPPFR